jgi:ubiquinone/menaquinone biosynthesis C-methylase UbiE
VRLRSRLAPGYEIWGRFGLYEPLVALGVGRSGRELRRAAVAALRLRPGESVLDIGTGTGLALPYLAAAVGGDGRVVGIDRSPAMLAGAKRRAAAPVEVVEGDATALPFENAAFDAAISTYGLTAIAEIDAALDEIVRVVRPGGRIAVADVHFVNWPTPAAVNRTVTAALRPFNTWYTDRDFPGLLRARGLRVTAVETHRTALSLTVAERRGRG